MAMIDRNGRAGFGQAAPSNERRLLLGGAACLAVLGGQVRSTERVRPLRVVAFAGASNWPIWVGQQRGFFAKEELNVTIEITPNSRQMASDVFSGKYGIALTSIDNVVSYDEGQGSIELADRPDFVAFMGVDDGMLSLMAIPGTRHINDLRGRTLSVDALATGFAFVLRDVLMRSGFRPDEIKFAEVGGGLQRLAALRDGGQTATLLNAPLDIIAESQGMVRLLDVSDEIGHYQGICGMARRVWLRKNRDAARAFVRGYRASTTWLTEPTNKADAVEILKVNMPNLPSNLHDKIYDRLTDSKRGIKRDLEIDREGLAKVLSLRSAYSGTGAVLSDPTRYVDESVRAEALLVR
jgi:ABC-type nitrate/sulfonate/bicarbonate transport system substrate-binding protein